MSNARAAAREAFAHCPARRPWPLVPPSKRPRSYGDALTEQYLASEHHGIDKANARDTRRDISGNGSDLAVLAGCCRIRPLCTSLPTRVSATPDSPDQRELHRKGRPFKF